jgi:ribosome-associated translation inhibitor RaiA
MQHNAAFKSFKPNQEIQRLIGSRIRKLERKTQAFPSDSNFLRIFVEANPARTLYRVTLTMDVPGKTIAAKEEAHDPKVSIKAAFDEVELQVQKHKGTLRHERLWKRMFKRDELRRRRVAWNKDQKREAFFQLVNPHLEVAGSFHFSAHSSFRSHGRACARRIEL